MKYIFLQNTITPYRISLFNKLHDLNLDFEVLYMCEQEKDRSWKIDYTKMHFPYVIDKGYYGMFKGLHIHWNPSLIKYIVEHDSKIILGGSWNDFNVLVICLLKRLGIIKSEVIFWSEANYLTIGARNDNLLKRIIRKFVYNGGDGKIIVPGQMAIDTFNRWHIKVQNFVILPNVIEEDRFKSFQFQKDDSMDRKPIFVLPARVNEKYKGILNFFKAIGIENIQKSIFYILGDGPDMQIIQSYIQENQLDENIILEGFCSMDKVVTFYQSADIFLLPSFSDPSPLSVVEAICCKLPLLISNRCGNHYEALEESMNGYSFDPDNHIEVRKSYELLMSRRSDWKKMGLHSRMLFEKNFQQVVVLNSFIRQLEMENRS